MIDLKAIKARYTKWEVPDSVKQDIAALIEAVERLEKDRDEYRAMTGMMHPVVVRAMHIATATAEEMPRLLTALSREVEVYRNGMMQFGQADDVKSNTQNPVKTEPDALSAKDKGEEK